MATGSRPALPPFVEQLSERVIDSTGALDPVRVPTSLLVVGGGYIGLELGSVYAALGTRVTVVEMLPQLMTGADKDLVSQLKRRLDRQFEAILLSTKVVSLKEQKNGVKVALRTGRARRRASCSTRCSSPSAGGPTWTTWGSRRRASSSRTASSRWTPCGASADGIWPSATSPAAHAGPQGDARGLRGGRGGGRPAGGVRARAIPAVCFTDPEIAWVGLTEDAARAAKRAVKTAKDPWRSIGRTLTLGRDDGLTKVIIDPETDLVLGVGLAGPGAGELISRPRSRSRWRRAGRISRSPSTRTRPCRKASWRRRRRSSPRPRRRDPRERPGRMARARLHDRARGQSNSVFRLFHDEAAVATQGSASRDRPG
ncbi:MAG: NAD-binding protein [Candidatus Krumholzibacteriia bacterium]